MMKKKTILLTALLTASLLLTACGAEEVAEVVSNEVTIDTETEVDETLSDNDTKEDLEIASNTKDSKELLKEETEVLEADTKEVQSETEEKSEEKTEASKPKTSSASTTTAASTQSGASAQSQSQASTETSQPAHTHNWVKVVDKAAYDEYRDEPVYQTTMEVIGNHYWMKNGMDIADWSGDQKAQWCMQHCQKCFPDAPDNICCSAEVKIEPIYDTVTTQVGTQKVLVAHHDEVAHYECSCGARK